MPVARCKPCSWDFFVSVGFGSLGWHVVPLKCPKKACLRHYLAVVHVTLVGGCLSARVAAVRQSKVAGEAGIRRALLEEPVPGMSESDVEMIVRVAALLAAGGSAAA